MKRTISLILVLALTATLFAGCAKTTAAPSSSAGESSAVTPDAVTVTSWQYPRFDSYEDLLGRYADAVKEKYPWITVETEMISWDAGPEKFTVAMATGSTPDLYLDGYSRIAPAVTSNLGADITDLVTEIKPNVIEGSQQDGVVDGKNYFATLWTAGAYCMAVNTTLAKQLGVDKMLPSDRDHWTYEDFLSICRAACKADKSKYAIALYAGSRSSDAWYYSWLLSGGTPITKADKTAAEVNTPEAAATLAVFKTLVDEGLCPAGAATMKDEDIGIFFTSGQTLFSIDGPSSLATIQDQMDKGEIAAFDYDVLSIPTPDGKDPKPATWGSNGIIIFKNGNDANKIDAAKKVAKEFFTNKELSLEFCNGFSTPFVVTGVSPEYSTERLTELANWNLEYTAKYSTSGFGILEGWWSNFRETFYVELQGIYTNSQTVEKALSNWETAANSVISAAK